MDNQLLPDVITVTIPAQEYDGDKYCGIMCRCYLEEQLDKAGYTDSSVAELGNTKIGGHRYEPETPFDNGLLREAFERGKSFTVTLKKLYGYKTT